MKAKMFTSSIILRKPRNAQNLNAIAHACAKEEKEVMVEAVMVVVDTVVVVTAMIIITAMIITAVAVAVVVDLQDLDIKPCTDHTRTKLYSGLIFLCLMRVLLLKKPRSLCSKMHFVSLMFRIRV